MKKQYMKTVARYLVVLLLGVGIVQAGDAYLVYTDELITARGEADYWKMHTDALLSRGIWRCFPYKNGTCTYRFVPNTKAHREGAK